MYNIPLHLYITKPIHRWLCGTHPRAIQEKLNDWFYYKSVYNKISLILEKTVIARPVMPDGCSVRNTNGYYRTNPLGNCNPVPTPLPSVSPI